MESRQRHPRPLQQVWVPGSVAGYLQCKPGWFSCSVVLATYHNRLVMCVLSIATQRSGSLIELNPESWNTWQIQDNFPQVRILQAEWSRGWVQFSKLLGVSHRPRPCTTTDTSALSGIEWHWFAGAMLFYTMLCCAMLGYAVLCYDILCYDRLW